MREHRTAHRDEQRPCGKDNGRNDTDTDFEEIEGAIYSAQYIKQAIANGEDFYNLYTIITVASDTYEGLLRRQEDISDYLYSRDITVKEIHMRLEDAFQVSAPLLQHRKEYLIMVSIASGIGCCAAVLVSNKMSKERTYVNVVMSDDKAGMQAFRDFLATHHITNVATDSYTTDWNTMSITITAYAETKEQSRLINDYIENSSLKCKRMIQKA